MCVNNEKVNFYFQETVQEKKKSKRSSLDVQPFKIIITLTHTSLKSHTVQSGILALFCSLNFDEAVQIICLLSIITIQNMFSEFDIIFTIDFLMYDPHFNLDSLYMLQCTFPKFKQGDVVTILLFLLICMK